MVSNQNARIKIGKKIYTLDNLEVSCSTKHTCNTEYDKIYKIKVSLFESPYKQVDEIRRKFHEQSNDIGVRIAYEMDGKVMELIMVEAGITSFDIDYNVYGLKVSVEFVGTQKPICVDKIDWGF